MNARPGIILAAIFLIFTSATIAPAELPKHSKAKEGHK